MFRREHNATERQRRAVSADGRQRLLDELNPGLIALALVAAPVPAALITLVLATLVRELSPQLTFVWAGVLFATSIAWTLVAGGTYGLFVTPWRRCISYLECLSAGGVTGALFPLAVVAFRHLGPRPLLYALSLPPRRTPLPLGVLDWTGPADYFIVASCLLFGILGGWTFWTIATAVPARLRSETA
jgi:hypothetical protein